MQQIKIDLNNPEFQEQWFKLEKIEQISLLRTFKKISKMTWAELYSDNGLKWESIVNISNKSKEKIYTFRFSQKYRALAIRSNEYLRVLTLHVDHDGAYK